MLPLTPLNTVNKLALDENIENTCIYLFIDLLIYQKKHKQVTQGRYQTDTNIREILQRPTIKISTSTSFLLKSRPVFSTI